ncbi:hypothetical protein, partial [Dyella jejuensis]
GHKRSGFYPSYAASLSGHFFGLLFFGPAKKSDSGAHGVRKRRRQCSNPTPCTQTKKACKTSSKVQMLLALNG